MPLLVGFELLDRQIADKDRIPAGTVDDVEFTVDGDGWLRVVSPLTGQPALGARLGGTPGRWITAVATRLDVDRRGPRRARTTVPWAGPRLGEAT